MDTKKIIRKKISQLRDAQTDKEIKKKSKKIQCKIISLPEFKKSKTVMFYIAFKSEVRTNQMIKKALKLKKRVVVPVVDKNRKKMSISELKDYDKELVKGEYGILRPANRYIRKIFPESIDLIIVPGLVFDSKGHRLGYGKGFYDRFLSRLRNQILKVGVAFDFQITDTIPTRSYDVRLDKIVTENRIIDTNKGGH